MEELIGSLMYSFIGWCYLWIRYRNKKKIQIILKEKYNDSYLEAGATKVLQFIGVVMIIILGALLLVIIY